MEHGEFGTNGFEVPVGESFRSFISSITQQIWSWGIPGAAMMEAYRFRS